MLVDLLCFARTGRHMRCSTLGDSSGRGVAQSRVPGIPRPSQVVFLLVPWVVTFSTAFGAGLKQTWLCKHMSTTPMLRIDVSVLQPSLRVKLNQVSALCVTTGVQLH